MAQDWEQQVLLGTGAGQGVPVQATPTPSFGAPAPLPTSTPLPPAEYMPPVAPGRNFAANIEMMGASLSGRLPMSLQVQQAEQEMRYKDGLIRQGWQNFEKTRTLLAQQMQDHDIKLASTGNEMMVNFRAQWLTSTPEQRKTLQPYQSRMLRSVHPASADIYDGFTKNPSAHLGLQYQISKHPELQDLMMVMPGGYQNEHFLEMAQRFNEDDAKALTAKLPTKIQQKMADGTMKQAEFVKALEAEFFNPETSTRGEPQQWQAIKEFVVGSKEGAAYMANLGVRSDMMALKEAESTAKEGGQKRAIDRRIGVLEPKEAAGTLTLEEQDELDRLRKVKKMEGDPQGARTTPTSLAISEASNGRYTDLSQIENPQERSQISVRANNIIGQRGPEGATYVKRGTPIADTELVFSKSGLKKHQLLRVTKNLPTPDELNRGDTDAIRISKPQEEALKDLYIAKGQAEGMFGAAKKIITATGTMGALGQRGQAFLNEQGVYVGPNAEHWKTYQAGQEAWASRLARAIGTERGVMTDTDVRRWKSTLPMAGDTANVVELKRTYFDKMYTYIREVSEKVAGGEFQDELVSDDKQEYLNSTVRSKVKGILGDFENKLGKSGGAVPARKSLFDKYEERQ